MMNNFGMNNSFYFSFQTLVILIFLLVFNYSIASLSWLFSSDTSFLIQLIRFLHTVITKHQLWYKIISENSNNFFNNIQNLFINCLNTDLLKSLFQFINQILYSYDDLGNRLIVD